MRKLPFRLCVWLSLLLTLWGSALAEGTTISALLVGEEAEEDFTLADAVVMEGMDKSYAMGYTPRVEGNTLIWCVPVRCRANISRANVSLLVEETSISPLKGQDASATARRDADGVYRLTLKTALTPGRVNGDYAAVLRVTGQDATGRRLQTDLPVLLPIRDGTSPKESVRPLLTELNGKLCLGERCTLTATLRNPSRYAAMTNLLLTVTDATGDILPAGSDKLMLPTLYPGKAQTLQIPLYVKPDAKVAVHQLQFSFTWQGAAGKGSWEESFTVPITQNIRLEQGGVQAASTLLQGSLSTLTLPLMNLGKGRLNNVLAVLTLPGVTERQAVLVGTLEPGETKNAKLSILPGRDVLGELTGQVMVTCEDDWGNTSTLTVPVSLTVEPEVVPVSVTDVAVVEKESPIPPWVLYALGGGCAVLLIALIAQGSVLRGKIRKLEEDRL